MRRLRSPGKKERKKTQEIDSIPKPRLRLLRSPLTRPQPRPVVLDRLLVVQIDNRVPRMETTHRRVGRKSKVGAIAAAKQRLGGLRRLGRERLLKVASQRRDDRLPIDNLSQAGRQAGRQAKEHAIRETHTRATTAQAGTQATCLQVSPLVVARRVDLPQTMLPEPLPLAVRIGRLICKLIRRVHDDGPQRRRGRWQ